MSMQYWLRVAGALLVLGMLSATLPGCGGEQADTTTVEDTGLAPIGNPTPEALKPEG